MESKLHQNGGVCGDSKPAQNQKDGEHRSSIGGKGKVVEIALLCVVMVVIWVSLALPVVIFYLPVSVAWGQSCCTIAALEYECRWCSDYNLRVSLHSALLT